VVPPELEAGEPPEARGLARDGVRMLVSWRDDPRVVHARFHDLGRFLERGDVLVVNTSGTLKAALPAVREGGRVLELHLSTRLPGGLWIVEVREADGLASRPFLDARAGETLRLPGGGEVRLLAPFPHDPSSAEAPKSRLWHAALRLPAPPAEYLESHGEPIRYGYVRGRWPIEMYQTVFATEPGSAEMPSAARPFTPELVTRLVARGVQFAPLLLHTGIASLEAHEPPYEEYYRVERETAALVNAARAAARRVVAVGTTAVRALETVTDEAGICHPGEGWTSLLISPARRPRAAGALLTGLHEPRATHLALLEAFAGGRERLRRSYGEALRHGYLWHEFGDVHLLLDAGPSVWRAAGAAGEG
jgi:S-adenosylmethionine:tRNA ribosyltransferase-isomerase